jgi:hypothetical protein
VTADEQDAARQAEVALEAFRDAAWDALFSYRETGELVPASGKKGGVDFLTVAEAQRCHRGRAKRRLATARRRAANLLDQLAAAGLPVPGNLWDRLEADAHARLADDLLYIAEARKLARSRVLPHPPAERLRRERRVAASPARRAKRARPDLQNP